MRKLLRGVVQYFERDGTATVDHMPGSTIQLPADVALVDGAVPWGCAQLTAGPGSWLNCC
jgi:hypothetical protein